MSYILESFPYARRSAKIFTNNLFQSSCNFVRSVQVLFPFYKWGNQDSEKPKNLPKVKQQASGRG